MDLHNEASSEKRFLSARHISAEKSFPESNNAINTTFLCYSYSLQPHFETYLEALSAYAWVLWSCGLILVLATCAVYALSLRAARIHWRQCFTNVAVVLAVYPSVAAAAFIAIVVPRARLLSEALAQQAVMFALYHLYRVIIAECGGAEEIVRCSEGSRLETRVLPCCCWPCCVIPRPIVEKRKLTWLRYLLLQMVVIQTLIYLIILVLSTEDITLYLQSFVYIQPIVAASILTGVWGMIMCVRAAEAVGATPKLRFLALQIVLLIVKLQCGFAKGIPEIFQLPCLLPLHPSVFVNMIHNSVMLVEMFLISLWAWRLYSVPPKLLNEKVKRVFVAVIDNSRESSTRETK